MKSIVFNGENHSECKAFIGNKYDNTKNYPNIITTAKGVKVVNVGDRIVKDDAGNLNIDHLNK